MQIYLRDPPKSFCELEELEQEEKQIVEGNNEARLFVNDKAGIIETALNQKTFTDPADPGAIRELKVLLPRKPSTSRRTSATGIPEIVVLNEGRRCTLIENRRHHFFEGLPRTRGCAKGIGHARTFERGLPGHTGLTSSIFGRRGRRYGLSPHMGLHQTITALMQHLEGSLPRHTGLHPPDTHLHNS